MENVKTFNIIRFSPLHRFAWEQIYWRKFVRDHAPDVLFSSANFGLLNSPVKQILLLREGGLFDPFYLANMTAVQGVGSAFNRYFRRRLMLMSARSASHIITPTNAMRDAVALWEPAIKEKCTVNPYGTINDAFRPGQEPRPWRAGGTLKLLYVSVYYPHKVPNLVCQAVDLLNRRGIQAHATITMSLEEFTDTRAVRLMIKYCWMLKNAGSSLWGLINTPICLNYIEITMCSSSRPCRKLLVTPWQKP